MYIIVGYYRGEKHYYNLKNNKWVNHMMEAEFFDDERIANMVIEDFPFNKHNEVTEGYGKNKIILATMSYIITEYYNDEEMAKKILTQYI